MSSHSTPHTPSVNHVNNIPSTSNGVSNTANTHSSNPASLPSTRPAVLHPNGQSNGTISSTNGVASGSISTTSTTPQPPLSWIERGSINRKRKWTTMGFNEPEQAVMERTTVGFHLALAQDQVSTLFPEEPSRFKSFEDVVEKLVPYHIWQVCDEELDGQEGGSQVKRKQREQRENEVVDVLSRMTKINQRLMALRTRSAVTPSPTVDLISLIRESTSALRDEVSNVQRDYRRLNAERDAIEMEAKRKADHVAYLRGLEAISKSNEERGNAAKEALRLKDSQAAARQASAAKAASASNSTPKSIARPTQSHSISTPASPAASPSSHHQTPTPTRGRGRPRGAGGGGLRTQVLTHGVAPSNGTPGSASPSPSVNKPGATPTRSNGSPALSATSSTTPAPTPAVASSPAGSNAPSPPIGSKPPTHDVGGLRELLKRGPVIVDFPTSSVPELLKSGILVRDPDPTFKPPGHIVTQRENQIRTLISLDVRKCKPGQLTALNTVLRTGGGFITNEDQASFAIPAANTSSSNSTGNST